MLENMSFPITQDGIDIKRCEGQHGMKTLLTKKTNLPWYPFTWPGRHIPSRRYYQVKQAFWTNMTIVLLQFALIPTLATAFMSCYFDCRWNLFVNGHRNVSHYKLGNDRMDPSLILHERADLRKILGREIIFICLIVGLIAFVGLISVVHIGLFVTRHDRWAKSRQLNFLYALIGILLIILTMEKISSTLRLQHENYPKANNNLKSIIQNANYSSEIIDSAKFLQVLLYSCLQFTDEEVKMPETNLKNQTKHSLVLQTRDYAEEIGICQCAYLNFISAVLTFILAFVCLMVPVVSVTLGAPIQVGAGRLSKFSNMAPCPAQVVECKGPTVTNTTKNKMQFPYAPSYPPCPYVRTY